MGRRLLVGVLVGLLWGSLGYAEPIAEETAIRAIIGEAEGESYAGKVALAYALQNRGSIRGVYGYKAISTRLGGYYRGDRKIAEGTVKEAIKALKWANSHPEADTTSGADHWEAVGRFGEPYWAKSMIKTVKIGAHQFYKEGI